VVDEAVDERGGDHRVAEDLASGLEGAVAGHDDRHSSASTAHFTFDMTSESFLQGHVCALAWLGGVPRECVYDNFRSAVARRDGDVVTWNARFVQLRGHYAFHATAYTPATPREVGSVEGAVRYTKTGFWPARRFGSLSALDEIYADWRDRVALPRRHATCRHIVAERWQSSVRRSERYHRSRLTRPGGRRSSRVPLDAYLEQAGSFYRAPEALVHRRWPSCALTAATSGSNIAARPSRAMPAATSRAAGSPRHACAPSTSHRAGRGDQQPTDRGAALSDYAALCA
jgi:hypothetical protein